jgi:hypothetical protein
VVQNACKPALIYPQLPSATSCPTLPVVSEWYQEATLSSLRVIIQALQGFARFCDLPISKPVSLLYLALCCTVLRCRWCQSGVNITLLSAYDAPVYVFTQHRAYGVLGSS